MGNLQRFKIILTQFSVVLYHGEKDVPVKANLVSMPVSQNSLIGFMILSETMQLIHQWVEAVQDVLKTHSNSMQELPQFAVPMAAKFCVTTPTWNQMWALSNVLTRSSIHHHRRSDVSDVLKMNQCSQQNVVLSQQKLISQISTK